VIIPRAEGGNFTASLTTTGVIRKVSKIVTCKNVTVEINIRNRYILTINPHSVNITPFPKHCYEFNSHNNHFVQASYQHDAKLLEEIAFHNQPHNKISNLVDGRLFSSVDNIRQSNPKNKLHWLNVGFSSYSDLAFKVVLAIFIIILGCCKYTICFRICYFCFRRKRQRLEVHNFLKRIPANTVN
jgi:hypothetical protein